MGGCERRWARPGPQDGVGIAFDDLSSVPTHTTVDRFHVKVTGLSAAATYEVRVSSDRPTGLGFGACGAASQTQTVSGAAAHTVTFVLYACRVVDGTVRAEVRETGADAAAATVSQAVGVLAIPDWVPADQRLARRNSDSVARAGRPGIVSGIHFDTIMDTSFRVKWSPPSDGGNLTGYGLLWWTGHVENDKPGYGDATSIGVPTTFEENGIRKQAQTLSGLTAGTKYHYLMHACNQTICGHWSYPAKSVTTTGTAPPPVTSAAPPPTTPTSTPAAPDRPHTIDFGETTSTSVVVTWRAPGNTGGAPLTGFDLKYWPFDSNNENSEHGATTQRAEDGNDRKETLTGLDANTTYELKMRACNQANNTNCSAWSDDHRFTTNRAPTPAPWAPSFESTGSLTSIMLVGQQESGTLPAASGGSGALTYQLAPAVGNGLTFDATTRTLAGTPLAATNLATYTYTVTDGANKTAQIPFHLTVVDVKVRAVQGGAFKPLANSEGGLDYGVVMMRESGFTRTDGHQFRLRLPASTGFEFGQSCQTHAAPTDTTVLASPWVDSNRGLYLVRCGLGAGAEVSFEVEVRRGTTGTAASLYTATTIPRSWHRHDKRVLYFIQGTLTDGNIDNSQLFPPDVSMTPHPTLIDPLNYSRAAKAWQDVPDGGVTLDRVLSSPSADVVISGYWDPGPGIKDQCGGSVACTYGAGTYPHLGNGQVFVIEDPPRWPGRGREEWTPDLDDATKKAKQFEYLPWVLMHEFGHTLGLGHSVDGDSIMGGKSRADLSTTDVQGLKATYAHHRDDH
ncbi:MAG: fibronectin type III domain-containing protein [Chloroflexota bacterium]|nr:fibronectin type III domain-containing protein [Chloroflexota bacterium]